MQIKPIFLLAVLDISNSITIADACETEWLKPPEVSFAPKISERVSDINVFVIKDENIKTAMMLLKDRAAVEILSEDLMRLGVPSSFKDDRHIVTLVRAVKDDSEGLYSAYLRGDLVLINYGHFGECGKYEKTALVIRSLSKIDKVYGGMLRRAMRRPCAGLASLTQRFVAACVARIQAAGRNPG